MAEMGYPILEFDRNPNAIINPDTMAEGQFSNDKLVIAFFPEAMEQLKAEGKIRLERTIPGENPILVYRFADADVLILLGAIGCPACAGTLDQLHAMGIQKVMFCGGGGVLDPNIEVGQLLLVEGSIRDEGFSYHYIEPSRIIYTEQETNQKIADYLEEHSVPYLRGLTWTTDAIFRETQTRIQNRRAEGAKIVEMEQSGCIAAAQFRGFSYGALIYGGDDVSQEQWDNRGWRRRQSIRYDLIELCKQLTEVL